MKKYTSHLITTAGFLVFAQMAANFLNFVFNAFLGRTLTFEQFGLITLVTTIWSLLTLALNALGSTVTHRSAFLTTRFNKEAGLLFFLKTRRQSIIVALVAAVVWGGASPLLASFFNVTDLAPIIIFAPLIFLGVLGSIYKGFLQAQLLFVIAGSIILFESIAKLGIAVGLVVSNNNQLVYSAIPASLALSAIAAIIVVSMKINLNAANTHNYRFPKRFYTAALLTGLSSTAFLSIDVILAKHFLSAQIAGQYALLSLVGKMIYFFGSLLNGFMITFISRDEGAHRNPITTFYRLLAGTVVFSSIGFILLGVLGDLYVPLLFGAKATAIVPFLLPYSLAIMLFTISNTIVLYHLARKQYLFSVVALFTSLILAIGIFVQHSSVAQIVSTLAAVSTINFVTLIILHFLQREGRFVLRNIIDLIDIFFPLPQNAPIKPGKKKILIFNWRDTRHSYAGGAEVYIHELAKRWVDGGNQVTIFCGNDSTSARNEVIDGVQIIRRGGFYFVYLWAFFYYFSQFRGRYDIIIDCQNGIPFFTPLYAKEPVQCLMFHVHQDVFRRSLAKPLASLAAVLENRVMPYVYRTVKFITISESTKIEMERLGIGKAGIEVIHPGVNLSQLKPGKKSKHPLIVYVGRLKYYKSINIFIKAAQKILRDVPTARFVIAGDGEEKRGLKDLTKRLELEKSIEFIGRVTEGEKRKLYQQAWVFVNPSMMEGWGITSIEANACATPVVASNVPGLRDSVQNPHTGYLVTYGDVNGFADKITLLIKDEKMRNRMSRDCVKWAKKFDWNKSAKDLLKVLQENEK